MKLILTHLVLMTSLLAFSQNYEDSVRELRVKHIVHLTDPENGVLQKEEIEHFLGLDYFLIDTSYLVTAKFKKDKGKRFKMPTTTERAPLYRRYGYVEFTLNGQLLKLTVYQNIQLKKQKDYKDYLFLPFRDQTSGNESYGGGRYLDLSKPATDTIRIDFNLSYNPYCAYSHRFSCPIPPAENTLSVPIHAGEKTPKGH